MWLNCLFVISLAIHSSAEAERAMETNSPVPTGSFIQTGCSLRSLVQLFLTFNIFLHSCRLETFSFWNAEQLISSNVLDKLNFVLGTAFCDQGKNCGPSVKQWLALVFVMRTGVWDATLSSFENTSYSNSVVLLVMPLFHYHRQPGCTGLCCSRARQAGVLNSSLRL